MLSEKSGLPPGSLIHIGDVRETVTQMSVIDYCAENVEQHNIQSIDEILKYKESNTVTWVIIEGSTAAQDASALNRSSVGDW